LKELFLFLHENEPILLLITARPKTTCINQCGLNAVCLPASQLICSNPSFTKPHALLVAPAVASSSASALAHLSRLRSKKDKMKKRKGSL
jgi:hypothetical protein